MDSCFPYHKLLAFGIPLCTAPVWIHAAKCSAQCARDCPARKPWEVDGGFCVAALLLMIQVPMARGRIRTAAWLFSIALLLVLTSSILAAMELPAGATTVYWALICGGVAIVNLASLVVFDVAHPGAPAYPAYFTRPGGRLRIHRRRLCATCPQRRQFHGLDHDLGDLDSR